MIPTFLICEHDFNVAWSLIASKLMSKGYVIPSDSTEAKQTKDACVTVELTGNAIQQIINRELHKDYPMKAGLDDYVNQFNYKTEAFEKSNDEQKYTYAGRLYDSALIIQDEQLLEPKYDRGVQLTTWKLWNDLGTDVRPCLQRMWIRKLSETECELHMTYRSHDAFAWQFNMIALVDYARRYLTKGLDIVKIVEFNDSLHIYDYDWDKASRVGKPTRNFRDGYE